MEATMFKTARCAPRSLDLSVDTKEPVKATWDTQGGVGPWGWGWEAGDEHERVRGESSLLDGNLWTGCSRARLRDKG